MILEPCPWADSWKISLLLVKGLPQKLENVRRFDYKNNVENCVLFLSLSEQTVPYNSIISIVKLFGCLIAIHSQEKT